MLIAFLDRMRGTEEEGEMKEMSKKITIRIRRKKKVKADRARDGNYPTTDREKRRNERPRGRSDPSLPPGSPVKAGRTSQKSVL